MKLHYITLLIAFFIGFETYAQVDKKTQLEQQKNDNLVKIKELNSIISKTSKKEIIKRKKELYILIFIMNLEILENTLLK